MRKAISFFVKYPIWVTVLFFGVIVYGVMALGQMRYSFFPEITPDVIQITVVYPGASPSEVAEGVVLKIEENLDGLEGVERVTSVSRENTGTITVETTSDSDIDEVLSDVKNAVDRINSFPEGAEEPIIFEQQFRTRSLSIVMFGNTDLYNLKYIAEDFRDDLLATEEISQVTIDGLPELEFSIEVSEAKLRQFEMTFDELAAAVRRYNVNISGGKLETDDEEVLIRAWGRGYLASEFLDIPVRGNGDGTVIYLKDVADVQEQWEDIPDKRYFNGRTALVLQLDQTEQEDILAIAEKAKEMISTFNEEHENVEVRVLEDRTIPLTQRVNLLMKNGAIGLLLIIIALGFFLNLRLSWWVAIAIPFSFAGMFVVANFAGLTINVISLFGMILVVGILVDDAIVVAENVYAHYERGKPALKSAVDGTLEVIAPVTTSVTTTILAFMPFFFLEAMLGKFIWQMALVVIASLAFSLVEAFLILPSHLAHSKGLHPHEQDSAFRKRIEKAIAYLNDRIYGPSLATALKYRWAVIATPIAAVAITVGLLAGGHIGATFFPFIDSDQVPINVSLVSGRQESDTDNLLAEIEQVCWQVNEELREEREDSLDVITGISRIIGQNDFGESGSHTGNLTLELLDGEQRQMESFEIANRIREAVGPLPGVQKITYGASGRFGKPVSISLLGKDPEQLGRARDMLKTELESFSSLKDVTDTDQKGRREIDIRLKPRAHALGMTLQDVAGQVRQGFFGDEVQRIQRGRDEIRVWVRYQDDDRTSLGSLDQMRIRTLGGSEYPFSELADYTIDRGVTQINRLDRQQEIKVEANLADVRDDLPPILADIRENVLPGILEQVQGVTVSFEGQSRDQAKLGASMARAFPLALIGMFILVVLVFRSYAQAVLIFSLIPIGILGAVWGHGIQGLQVNMLSMFGVIALSGIIINDSIVLVDQINRYLREGMSVFDAVFKGGLARLRPILLTTMTTSLGLAPLILETSRQAQFLIPMAVSVAYGLVFGTFVLLIILPAAFLCFNDVRVLFQKLRARGEVTPEDVEPAVKERVTSAIDGRD
ncbi:AcrB/AcrD/AcrF family protein, partial [candidate division GN15 bacterium]|nr:AcrB/AcrD/AcrF family protein [candidate division GN15 bacterium]